MSTFNTNPPVSRCADIPSLVIYTLGCELMIRGRSLDLQSRPPVPSTFLPKQPPDPARVYMTFGGHCLRQLRCNNTSYNTLALARKPKRQTRVFVSCSQLRARPIPFLRSPYQWSNIVHHIRRPGALVVPSTMGMDSQINTAQARTHAGHSHKHHHNHDNTYLTSSNKKDPGVRITRIGLYVNLGMAIGKGIGGYVFNSQA